MAKKAVEGARAVAKAMTAGVEVSFETFGVGAAIAEGLVEFDKTADGWFTTAKGDEALALEDARDQERRAKKRLASLGRSTALRALGLKPVRGAMGGRFWE
jgi:hypothetical protein